MARNIKKKHETIQSFIFNSYITHYVVVLSITGGSEGGLTGMENSIPQEYFVLVDNVPNCQLFMSLAYSEFPLFGIQKRGWTLDIINTKNAYVKCRFTYKITIKLLVDGPDRPTKQ